MHPQSKPIFIGDTLQKTAQQEVHGEYVNLLGETFYKIKNYDGMAPFFMSLVSSSNHWLFISSTGGLSAGRINVEQALFPYYTDDKISENHENTGNKAILRITRAERTSLWEPFSIRQQGMYVVERNLYKNVPGTVLVFEEVNQTLGLVYRYAWRTSDLYGFVKTTWMINTASSACQVELLDGLQNILPANITSATQNTLSNLLNAYKRSELHAESGLAMFMLNSTLTDLAEPSESLLASIVYQLGLDQPDVLLSSTQLDAFRGGMRVQPEQEVRGQRGAYFVHDTLKLSAGEERCWHLVAEVGQDSSAIVHVINLLKKESSTLRAAIETDIALNTANLEKIVGSADGVQTSNQPLRSAQHFANVMFNEMRGGYFADQYQLDRTDFIAFVRVRKPALLDAKADFFAQLPASFSLDKLQGMAMASGSIELIRLSYAYLPLSFSRRHGDPSRPWNRFAINIKKEDGTRQLDYEGNWRDIFQNWEALAYAYPEYVESMISTFLNATTVDGYNPYRITRNGIDWEIPEPENPWANIGYWSDHQIIYLQKLMEISVKVHPGKLLGFLNRPMFSFANVPYRIKPYEALVVDPYNTIEFDFELEKEIERRVEKIGSDGKLVMAPNQQVYLASLAEKLLNLLLAKLSNFVPEGGIWMSTQRPEWNDANNALVGKGMSVVTLCYLRRFVVFFQEMLEQTPSSEIQIGSELHQLYRRISKILQQNQGSIPAGFNDTQRRALMDGLGQAGAEYRGAYYAEGLSGETRPLPVQSLADFLSLSQGYIEQTLRVNKRSDNLYHAYNILHLKVNQAIISPLYEMLEGQVAVLSSGMLTGEESLALLQSMRQSRLFRADQHTYILYPDREVQGFLEKNCLTPEQASGIKLFAALIEVQDTSLILQDENGNLHFNGRIRNLKDVDRQLGLLKIKAQFKDLVEQESQAIKGLFEQIFRHNEFTGRSGTFFGYEGLGSVYWHMVSKLSLAVKDTILRTHQETSTPALIQCYQDIRLGQSMNKPPAVYGAFPTDPYSHTPKGQGAKQPGMTGSVKEEILTRQVELGLQIEQGQLVFDFLLFDREELLDQPGRLSYWDAKDQQQRLDLPAGTMGYTICQVPVILQLADKPGIQVVTADGDRQFIEGHVLDVDNSRHIFLRDGFVHHLLVSIPNRP
jgi:hypothetical protein